MVRIVVLDRDTGEIFTEDVGDDNPVAIYRTPFTIDEYMNARMISDPICLLDCDVPVDGSYADIVSRIDNPRVNRKTAVNAAAPGRAAISRRRAPRWLQEVGMEWSWRLAMEPRKMWKRYLTTNSEFAWLAAREILSRRLSGARGVP